MCSIAGALPPLPVGVVCLSLSCSWVTIPSKYWHPNYEALLLLLIQRVTIPPVEANGDVVLFTSNDAGAFLLLLTIV